MNPFDLDATGLLVWGLVAHLIADWMLQNAWIAEHKSERRPGTVYIDDGESGMDTRTRQQRSPSLWNRHPAAYVHAGIHCALLALVFGWFAFPLALVHLVIDTRTPVAWWARLMRQTPAYMATAISADAANPEHRPYKMDFDEIHMRVRPRRRGPLERETLRADLDDLRRDLREWTVPVFTVGMLVRMAVDQVFHVVSIAVAALIVGAL